MVSSCVFLSARKRIYKNTLDSETRGIKLIKHILFGSGRIAQRILRNVEGEIDIAYIIDNDKNKWGINVLINNKTYRVYSPDELKNDLFDEI